MSRDREVKVNERKPESPPPSVPQHVIPADGVLKIIYSPVQEKVEFNKTAKSGNSWEITAATPERVLELHNKMKELFPEPQVQEK
jgi:hypothetical protein